MKFTLSPPMTIQPSGTRKSTAPYTSAASPMKKAMWYAADKDNAYASGAALGGSRRLVWETADMMPRPRMTKAPTMIQVCGR
jgi:hypothetical protein